MATEAAVSAALNASKSLAMALSPAASLSLSLINNGEWRESARNFADELRCRVYESLASDRAKAFFTDLDQRITYMDWTYDVFGIDFSRVWDPELWVRFKEAVQHDQPAIFWNSMMDKIDFRDIIPQAGLVGDMRLSYARFMHLLKAKRIKRIVVYGDRKTALVEVPHPWYASIIGAPGTYPFYTDPQTKSNMSILIPNPEALDDPTQWFCPEMPEWNMEKYRFYVDLPGDFWEDEVLLAHLRQSEPTPLWDKDTSTYIMPFKHITKVFEVRTELQLLDHRDTWEFASWLLNERRVDFYEKAACICLAIRFLALSINLLTSTQLYRFIKKKTQKKSKKESAWERMTSHTAREFMTVDAKTGKMRDTGVRFEDIAGMDQLVFEMREIIRLLLQDPQYTKVGAKAPRGIIFQGPPGTGKTYLARAIAGEAGLTFLSAVGSEFVEMFTGVAAARVNSLYSSARAKAPCIIFIDEVDAIGRSRLDLGGDPGSMERESALLSLLVQMDGIHGNLEQVLTIGATNLAADLDHALLRPGRFEVVYEIPSPGPVARLQILTYHARNKRLADDELLVKVAELTNGWSAAALANLLNEAAILTVRRNVESITLPMMVDIIEGINWGERAGKIPPSEAKGRLAAITAAKGVSLALTPGVEWIKRLTLWSRRRGVGPTVEFEQSEESLREDWHPEEVELMDWKTNFKVNAATMGEHHMGEFLHMAALLVPLYAPRAAELELYGADSASLATAAPIADAFSLAYYAVRNSSIHPRFRGLPPLMTTILLGEDRKWRNKRDPLAVGLDEEMGYHKLTLTLLKASWKRAVKLVRERRAAIEQVAAELLSTEDEAVSGPRLVEIIESAPLADSSDIELGNEFLPLLKEVLARDQVPRIILEAEGQADADGYGYDATADVASASAAAATFADGGRGRAGQVEFFRALTPSPVSATSGSSVFGPGYGAPGQVTFSRPEAPRGRRPPALRVDMSTVLAVSRAIMGRLDVVDLVGQNTAEEMADRVREALLHPETVERLTAVRKWVERPDGAFPPAPLDKDVPTPVYGAPRLTLEFWKQRRIDVVTGKAVEMLFNERQFRRYWKDADVARWEDTSIGSKQAAEKARAKASVQESAAAEGPSGAGQPPSGQQPPARDDKPPPAV